MLKVTIPNNNLQERTYVLEVLLGEFLQLDYKLQVNADYIHYEISLDNSSRVIIEDHFFSKYAEDLTYLNEKHLPVSIQFAQNQFLPEKDIPVIYGSDYLAITEKGEGNKEIICGIDVFASAFFMLTRWEEYVNKEKDKLQRFSGRSSIAYKNNFLHRPVVNEYASMLRQMLVFLGHPVPPPSRKFSAYITHDVDNPLKWYSLVRTIRVLTGDLIKRGSIKLFLSDMVDWFRTITGMKKDPFDTFDYLMTFSERLKTRSYFFFISEDKSSRTSKSYKITHPFIKKLIAEINDRGHHIGFHPGLSTFNNPERWMKQLNHLKDNVPQKILTGRQHYLQFEIPYTLQIWNDAGMLWDSSVSYDDEVGFRAGSCYAYSVFNFHTRKKLKLKERPLIIMDKALVLDHKEASADQLIEYSKTLIHNTRKYNGDFVFLWHNHSFNLPEWEEYKIVHTTIMENLKTDDD
jgi:hypothetical protein